jgi:hypothetical protein
VNTAILFWAMMLWRDRAERARTPRNAKACEAALFAALRNFCAENEIDFANTLRSLGVDVPPAIGIAPDQRYQAAIETGMARHLSHRQTTAPSTATRAEGPPTLAGHPGSPIHPTKGPHGKPR